MSEARKFRPLIWVEGLIGCGKTTFSKEVGKRLNLRVLEEPVDSNPYLDLFYKEPKRFAFGMQMHLLHVRYAMQQVASYEATGVGGASGAILDRSLSGDRVFAKLHMKAGNIHPLEWDTYELSYSNMARSLLPPTLLIFLDVQPETAFDRMKKRNRAVESGVQLSYLKDLYVGYKELLEEAKHGLLPWAHAVKVTSLIWELDTVTPEQWDRTAKTVKEMFEPPTAS